jgi:hypothetical protein
MHTQQKMAESNYATNVENDMLWVGAFLNPNFDLYQKAQFVDGPDVIIELIRD